MTPIVFSKCIYIPSFKQNYFEKEYKNYPVVPVAKSERFTGIKLSRLGICRALRFQTLPDVAHEPHEYMLFISLETCSNYFLFKTNDSKKK